MCNTQVLQCKKALLKLYGCVDVIHERLDFLLSVLDIVQYHTKASIQSRTSKEEDLCTDDRVCMSMLSAHEVAQSFSSSFPYFVKTMKSFNVSGSYTLVGFVFVLFYFW